MAALVATKRHLWLTLSNIKEKDRVFLMDTPLAPSGLFGEAENTVVDRFQEAKKQAEAFQQFLPRRSAYGACLSSVPSGDRLVNPATPGASGQSCLQRVQLSASTQKCSSSGGSLPPRSLEQLDRLFPAGPTLQGTDLVILITPEVSPERLIPLVDYLKAWKLLQNVSQWVLRTAERGLQNSVWVFPPRLLPSRWPLLTTESLGFTASISSFQRRMGVASDFRSASVEPLSHVTQVQNAHASNKLCLRSGPRTGLWMIDLKDTYFHISILPQHRKFLRFAFGAKRTQYWVLPFGLALSTCTFTKCMDAALAPLRLQGIRILNYIDDWLILAQSEQIAVQHLEMSFSPAWNCWS